MESVGEAPASQKYLGKAGLLVLLAAYGAFPALSTDLYLPALPKMTAYFGVPEYQTNLTLTLFLVFYAAGLVLSGPLSDRFGRKPVALVGMVFYTVGGALCAAAGSIIQLVACRVLQAIGAASAGAVATAIVKDVYTGKKQERTLAVVQSMTVLSPVVAPILGGLLLKLTSWRGAFVAQGTWGLLMLVGTLFFQETLVERLTGNPLASLKRLGVVLKNRDFAFLLGSFSLMAIAIIGFITSSSYIYEVRFGMSSQAYALFFALFGVGAAVGPLAYLLLSRWLDRSTILTGALVAYAVSGILVLFVGRFGPWHYILSFLPAVMALGCTRPPSTYLMLAQHEADAGSASGLITASHMILGSIGTVIVSLEIWGRIEMVGVLILATAAVALLIWLGISRPRVRAQGLD